MTKISIIIPNYNTQDWLVTTIKSVLSQKGRFKKEVIVVDDHSTDDSWHILRQLQNENPEEVVVYRNIKKGANEARNYGFLKSTGEFIQWLDSDDQLLPNKLEKQLLFLENNPDSDIVYSDWQMIFYDQKRNIIDKKIIKRKEYKDFLMLLLQNEFWNVPSTYLMRRGICERTIAHKGWNTSTKVGQDREFYTIAAILGAKFSYVPGIFSTYNRWSNETISTKFHYRKIAAESLKLNQIFYDFIRYSTSIKVKKKYLRILNSEILNVVFHHRHISIPRRMLPWEFSLTSLHWKLRLISPFLYIKHLFKEESP